MELGELTEDVARRELFEETRLQVNELTLINVYSGPEHFMRAANGDEFYVVTTAYYAENAIGDLVIDQAESITELTNEKAHFFRGEMIVSSALGTPLWDAVSRHLSVSRFFRSICLC